jgi:hypothetical protein
MLRPLRLVLALVLLGCCVQWPQASLAQTPTGFATVAGDQIVIGGQPITLRGVNYYPQGKPWADMWEYWDGYQIERELLQARDELGINVVRVLIPFGWADWDKTVNEEQLDQLRQLTSIAGRLNLRLIMTLFDFSDEFEQATSRATNRQLQYLRAIVPAMANDERILAWDIHNEPDHYNTWKRGDAQNVLGWLGMMADEIRRLDPNHLITVGMGQYDNLWQPGPDGRRVIDYSDIVSVHIYNAADAQRQLDELRTYTSKPILLEEFGWPTGPTCAVQGFDEAAQAANYHAFLQAAQGRTVGTVAWALRDYDSGPSMRWDSHQEHYGLYRPDGSLKPAAEVFRAVPVPPLVSNGPNDLPLTIEPYNPKRGRGEPVLIPEANRHLKGQYRHAWELLGGKTTFGLPLSEAYERYEDNVVVQFFAGTVIEFHPKADRAPDWDTLSREEQIKRQLLPLSIGRYHAEQRGFAPGPYPLQGEFARFYAEHHGPWRFGEALSPEVWEPVDGVDTLVQYFERGRLEWDAPTNSVRVGALGAEAWRHQCAITGWGG